MYRKFSADLGHCRSLDMAKLRERGDQNGPRTNRSFSEVITGNPVVRLLQRGFSHIRGTLHHSQATVTNRISVVDILPTVIHTTPDKLKQEFESLPDEHHKPHEAAKKHEDNITPEGIYPYDDNRVKLPVSDGSQSDYINASHIHGYLNRRKYIAAKGPTETSTAAFWQMVWHEGSHVIVMLDGSLEKQPQHTKSYLPENGGEETYGDIFVKGTTFRMCADFIIRTFTIHSGLEERSIVHLQFTSWPDESYPTTPIGLVDFHQKYRSVVHGDTAAPVVHCMDGASRTGVFIALDMLVEENSITGHVDIPHCVGELRKQRTRMVTTLSHYEFLYKTVALTLGLKSELVPRQSFAQHLSKMEERDDNNTCKLDTLLQACFSTMLFDEFEIADLGLEQEKRGKDRPTSEIPDPRFRPDLGGVYINAVYADRYCKKGGFIMTQMPTPKTVDDFCKLVMDTDCGFIVMLNSLDPDDQSNGIYWPAKGSTLSLTHANITCLQEEQTPTFIVRTLQVESLKDDLQEPFDVQMVQFTAWSEVNVLPDVASLVEMVRLVSSKPDKQLLVHCLNGSDQSGLFCVVYDLLERLEVENEISVVNCVRKLRHRRPLAITNVDQLRLCYQAVEWYIKTPAVNENGI